MEENKKVLERIDEIKYLSQENTPIYRTIMRFLYNRYEQAEYWLYKDDIYQAIKDNLADYSEEELERNLQFLVDNGSLTKLQDTQNIMTIDDFKYHNFRYQLTDRAVLIERMTIELEEMEVKVASLEPRLFERINLLLTQLIKTTELDENKNYELWVDLNHDFKSLNEQYQDFLKKFHEVRTEELLKSELFLEFKNSVINYINDFIASYIKSSTEIKKKLMEMDETKVKHLMDSLIFHQRKAPKISPEFDYDKLRRINEGKWLSLRKWFIGEKTLSEGERLLEATQTVIQKIYKYADSLLELHGNMINRKEEYKRVCQLFDECQTIEEAHMLSGSIFGIVKVKHFKGNSLINTDSLINSYQVPPLEIEIESNIKEYKTKTTVSPIVDKSEEKLALLNRRQEEEKKRKAIIEKLIQTGRVELKDRVYLEVAERKYLLKLIEKYKGKSTKETEFGYFYQIENLPGECLIDSPDGIFKLNSRLIKIEVGEENG